MLYLILLDRFLFPDQMIARFMPVLMFKSTMGELAVFYPAHYMFFSVHSAVFSQTLPIYYHPSSLYSNLAKMSASCLIQSSTICLFFFFFCPCLSSQCCLLGFFQFFPDFFPSSSFPSPLVCDFLFSTAYHLKMYCLPLPHNPFSFFILYPSSSLK